MFTNASRTILFKCVKSVYSELLHPDQAALFHTENNSQIPIACLTTIHLTQVLVERRE